MEEAALDTLAPVDAFADRGISSCYSSRFTTTYSWGHVSRYVTASRHGALAINSMMCDLCRATFSTVYPRRSPLTLASSGQQRGRVLMGFTALRFAPRTLVQSALGDDALSYASSRIAPVQPTVGHVMHTQRRPTRAKFPVGILWASSRHRPARSGAVNQGRPGSSRNTPAKPKAEATGGSDASRHGPECTSGRRNWMTFEPRISPGLQVRPYSWQRHSPATDPDGISVPERIPCRRSFSPIVLESAIACLPELFGLHLSPPWR